MAAVSKAGFRDFVVARRHRLLRTAYLLARDRDRAVRLLERALARTRRHWRQLVWGEDPEGFALRALVALYVPRSERVSRAVAAAARQLSRLAAYRHGSGSEAADVADAAAAEAPQEQSGAEEPAAGDSDDTRVHAALWAALGSLRPLTRAALVLRHYEELEEGEAAGLLGCSRAALRAEEARGLASLRAALARHPERGPEAGPDSPGTRAIQDELREVLARCAAALPPEHDPYDRTARGIRRTRRRRAAASSICVCLLAAVAVPVAVFRPFRDVPLEGWYVRGSLADDSAFLEAARAEAVEAVEMRSNRGVEYSRVVYAGDEGGKRRVVAVLSLVPEAKPGQTPDGAGDRAGGETVRVLLALRGEAGANRESLGADMLGIPLPGSPAAGGFEPDVPHVALTGETSSGGRTLFVLGPPETRVMSYSAAPRFHPDGTWSRGWTSIPGEDGVAFAEVPERAHGVGMVRLRLPDDTTSARVLGSRSESWSPGELPDVAGLSADSVPTGVMNALTELPFRTGLPLRRFDVRVLWHGEGERWRSGESWLLAAELPNGATFQVLSTPENNHVFLVPRGRADRPAAVSSYPLEVIAQAEESEVPQRPREWLSSRSSTPVTARSSGRAANGSRRRGSTTPAAPRSGPGTSAKRTRSSRRRRRART